MGAMKSKILLVATLLAASAVIQTPTTTASTPAGGRVTLQEPFRGFDTRFSGGPITEVTGLAPLAHVWVLDSKQPGSATIHPCGDPPGPNPSLLFDAGELVYTTIASSTPMCLTSTTPVDVVEDELGGVSPDPSSAGLQYAALAAPLVVFEGQTPEFDPFQSNPPPRVQVPFDLGVIPSPAKAAVLLLESTNPSQPGFVDILGCGSQSLSADSAWINSRAVGIAYIPLVPGSGQLCFTDQGATTLRVTLLGYLQDDGPDPMSLPPTLSYPVQDAAPPGLRAITPVRLIDTRQPLGVPVAQKLQAGTVLELKLGDHVADSTTAVALNVTVTEPDGDGFLTVFPCDQAVPKASNLNYVAGETVPNLVNAKLSITDTVCFFSNRTTHLIVDLMGTFERGGGAGAQSVAPARLLDTRKPIGVPSIGKLGAGQTLVLQVAGRGDVPADNVAAATLNVTVTEPDGAGFVTAYPCDRDRPTASNLNFVAGQTVPNLVTVRLSASGTLCLFTSATTHLVADIAAWYSVDTAQGYHELPPQRILDTREPIGVPAVAKLAGGQVLTLQVAGQGGIPLTGARAVTMNVTVTEPEQDGFVTIYPCDAQRPEASNLNFTAGETVPNLATVKVSAAGTVCLYAQRTTHLVADVAGYFTDVPEALRVGSLLPQS
jgi:hypothetical protein